MQGVKKNYFFIVRQEFALARAKQTRYRSNPVEGITCAADLSRCADRPEAINKYLLFLLGTKIKDRYFCVERV